MPSAALLSVAPSDLVALLGSSTDGPKHLLQQLRSPDTQQPDYWVLLSVIDLADVLLWSYVDAPEGEGDRGHVISQLYLGCLHSSGNISIGKTP